MLPAEGGLRRIIGDGESRPDGEVEGLGPEQLLALYRDRSLADVRRAIRDLPPPGPHRHLRDLLESRGDAGRLGLALEAGLGLPELSRLGDRSPARHARVDRSLVVARPSGWLVESGGLQRRLDLRPHRDAIPHAVGFAWGSRLKGEDRVAIVNFGDGATSEGSFHEVPHSPA